VSSKNFYASFTTTSIPIPQGLDRKANPTNFELAICGLGGAGSDRLGLMMNSLGKSDGKIAGTDMRLELHNHS
jgi:hypothetical protein